MAEAPIQDGQCRAHLAVATGDIEVRRRVAVPIPLGQCQAPQAAADTAALLRAAETMAGRRVADHAEATPEADHMAALLLVADTITTKGFLLVSPHTSLTVRRLRKEPPVLP